MSLAKQKGFATVAALFITGFLAVTAMVIFSRSQEEQEQQARVTPSASPSPLTSPSPSPSILPSPSASPSPVSSVLPWPTESLLPEPQAEIFIENIKYEKENGRPKITLTGKKFGDKRNQVVFDNNVHNYGYTILSWNDNHIEFYGSEWVPKDKTVSVAVIRNDGVKSNTVYFFNTN